MKNKKFKISIGLIIAGFVIGLIIGMSSLPEMEYVDYKLPLAYIFKGDIDASKDIEILLNLQEQIQKRNIEFSGLYKDIDELDLVGANAKLKELSELVKAIEDKKTDKKYSKRELVTIKNQVIYYTYLKDYLKESKDKETIKKMIFEDLSNTLVLEQKLFEQFHFYVDKNVNTDELRALLKIKKNALTTETNEDQKVALEKEIKDLEKTIVDKQASDSGIKSFKILLGRENDVNKAINDLFVTTWKYDSVHAWVRPLVNISLVTIFASILGVIGIFLALSFVAYLVKRKMDYKTAHKIAVFKDYYFERSDSFFTIIGIYALVIIMSVITVIPLLNVLSVALRPNNNLFSTDLRIIPPDATLNNFKEAIFRIDLPHWLLNSLLISCMTSVVAVILSATAGYAFSRFKFRGRKTGMVVLLVTQMFPAPMLLLPTYVLITRLGLINNLFGLLIPYVASAVPFSVWLLKGYFDTISPSLEESAYVDGCSPFATFVQIILPLAKPALAIAALNSFMAAWSEYVVAKIIVTGKSVITLPVGLVTLQGQFQTEWGVYSAAALITSIPVIILFISLSRFLVGGLTLGGVKE